VKDDAHEIIPVKNKHCSPRHNTYFGISHMGHRDDSRRAALVCTIREDTRDHRVGSSRKAQARHFPHFILRSFLNVVKLDELLSTISQRRQEWRNCRTN